MEVRRLTSAAYLKLQGVDAKEHAVFRELTRVKQYFEKISNAEPSATATQPSVTLNKEAAERVIKHALVGLPGHARIPYG